MRKFIHQGLKKGEELLRSLSRKSNVNIIGLKHKLKNTLMGLIVELEEDRFLKIFIGRCLSR